MTWSQSHDVSEKLAASAHEALKNGELERAKALFALAAKAETAAFEILSDDKPRTLGISAVSATALWYKARKFQEAEQVAHKALGRDALPLFARNELRTLLQAVWNEEAQDEAGIGFLSGQVVVSVRGGEVVTGGAPLDLILSKVQTVQSLFFRTAELLKSLPLRTKGPPSKEIQERYKPWLFQSVPGSYQFVVAIQKPAQPDLFPTDELEPDVLTDTFLSILRAASEDAPEAMEAVVPEPAYRTTFLKLARSLAPTGKTFSEMEIRGTGDHNAVILSPQSRRTISETLRPLTPTDDSDKLGEKRITGTLRAVHLEDDWLEVIADGQTYKIVNVGETVDDVIGPMVNHQVNVRAKVGKNQKLMFVDIERDE